jgi:hypothetical protein
MEVEWLILADFAQMVANKLYLQGGGWDKLTVNSGFPVTHQMGMAASFRVPWNETNQENHVEVEVVTDDGDSIAKISASFTVGRPADIPAGQDQRSQIAGNLALQLPRPGTYTIIARIENQEAARTHFNVVVGPFLSARQQQAGSQGPLPPAES